jgi:hypothetical protein
MSDLAVDDAINLKACLTKFVNSWINRYGYYVNASIFLVNGLDLIDKKYLTNHVNEGV